jgi:membrane-associated protease RseP (regulator of RpoE activity)
VTRRGVDGRQRNAYAGAAVCPGAMVSLWTVFGVLAALYIVALVWAGRTESERIQVVGPLIMVRTQAGKKLIDRISKRNWLGPLADFFIVLTVLSGLAMVVLVAWQNTLLFTHTEQVSQNPPEVEQTLAIPGINPAIPVGYGLLALVVALVIHEGGHGVMARFANLKVKSLGLLFLVLPVGAFVEPDEAELQGASLREKLRMFAGGPGPNMVLGAITVLLFSQMFIPMLAPAHDGVGLMGVSDELPAGDPPEGAALPEGGFVTHLDGQRVDSLEQFQTVLNNTRAGENLTVTVWHRGEVTNHTIVPIDKYEYYERNAPEQNKDWYRDKAFIGVSPAGPDELDGITANLESPFEEMGLRGGLFYLALPFVGWQPFPTTFHELYDPGGFAAGFETSFWIAANALFWLFWINVVLGTFNALPLGPLDGGHMFRHTAHWWFRRGEGIEEEDLRVFHSEEGGPSFVGRTQEIQSKLDDVDRKVSLVNRTVGFGLLVLVVAPLIVPQFL